MTAEPLLPSPPLLLTVAILAFILHECVTLGRITRWLMRFPYVFFIYLELGAIAAVRKAVQPRFVLMGDCHQCGDCCRSILGVPPGFVRKTRLINAYLWYHRVAHRFSPVGVGPNDEILFECGHLQSDGRCGIYWHRPFLCRNYPLLPLYQTPALLPSCSFQIAPRVVAQMRPHPRLPVLNSQVAVHHPTSHRSGLPEAEDFHHVDPN